MRKIFCLLFLLVASNANALTKYWVGTTSTSWSLDGNWGLVSGVAGGTVVPTSSDSVVLDAGGNNDCTADAGSPVCTGFFVTSGYTHNLTCTVNILMDGTVTLGANMTFTASTTNGLKMTPAIANETLKSNGVTCTVLLTFVGTITMTLSDNWTTTGGFQNAGAMALTLNSNTMNIAGGTFNLGAVGNTLLGTTAFVLGPTGSMTWQMAASATSIANNVTINTTGTLTISTGVQYKTGTLTYTAGTVVTTGSTLTLVGACTLNTNGVTWNNVTFGAVATFTINSLLSIGGTLTLSSTPTFAGTSGWTCATLSINPTASQTVTLKSTNTYTVTSAINYTTGSGFAGTMKSSTSSSSALLNYSGTSVNENILNIAFTDIDASGGTAIWTYGKTAPTLTRTTNINTSTNYAPLTVSAAW